MLRRITFSVFLVAITVAVSSAPALAKGPEPMTATIRGPWLAHPIIVRGFMGKAPGDPYWRLTSLTFDSLWAVQATAPRLSSLGPRYAVEYMDPCCGHQVHQDLYPYAPGGPWTYTPRGQAQQLFQMDLSAQQGWYHAPTALFSLLSHQGLPPIPASSGLPRLIVSGSGSNPIWPAALVIAVFSLSVITLLLAGLRRRANRMRMVHP